nr:MATE family efflux transporter [Lachnospiraceae bacterium]
VEIFSGSLRAQNVSVLPTVINLFCICALRMFWILVLVPHGTMEQMIVCYPVTWIICGIAMSGIYLRFLHKQKQA